MTHLRTGACRRPPSGGGLNLRSRALSTPVSVRLAMSVQFHGIAGAAIPAPVGRGWNRAQVDVCGSDGLCARRSAAFFPWPEAHTGFVLAARSPPQSHCAPTSLVIKRLGSAWSQADLGDAIDLSALAAIADMDSSGTNDLIVDILSTLQRTLGPTLERIACHRVARSAAGVRFEAHRIKSAATQLGAGLLADAASAILEGIPPETRAEAAAFRALTQKRAAEGLRPLWGMPSAVGCDSDAAGTVLVPPIPDDFARVLPLVDRMVREIVQVQTCLARLIPAAAVAA